MESSITLKNHGKEFGGNINAIASKSHAHRLLLAGALTILQSLPDTERKIEIICNETSLDIEATSSCLNSMGVKSERIGNSYILEAACNNDKNDENICKSLDSGESGSTLRFILPVIGMLGINAAITTHGRLTERPLSPLYEEMIGHGVTISPVGSNPLKVSGKMSGGIFTIAGNISSQYITGLLLALPLANEDSEIRVTGELASRPYVDITLSVLETAGIKVDIVENPTDDGIDPNVTMIFKISGNQHYNLPDKNTVEGDWSNSAFFLAAGAIKNSVTVKNLNLSSKQGDMKILDLLKEFGAKITVSNGCDITVTRDTLKGIDIDEENIPDLVPILSLVVSLSDGTTPIRNIERLRLKESDRVATVIDLLTKLGADIREENRCLVINGKAFLIGGTIDSFNDHRIAMTAGIASIMCNNDVTIINEKAVRKSYPGFFNDLASLIK